MDDVFKCILLISAFELCKLIFNKERLTLTTQLFTFSGSSILLFLTFWNLAGLFAASILMIFPFVCEVVFSVANWRLLLTL